jgi:NADPH-dependent curcumin reductase CurA
MPGLTGYSEFYEIGKPKRGEVIFISAASGAVRQLVGQLAKREGLTVIGSVGSEEKVQLLMETFGFDGGFNYRTAEPELELKRLAPEGIDSE